MRKNGRSTIPGLALAVVLVAAGVPGAGAAGGGGSTAMVFSGSGPQGKVWVNVDLTRQRTDQPYVPLVVAVQNMGARPAVVKRESFRLLGSSGKPVPLASIEEVRKEYPKLNFDARTVKAQAMPFGTRLSAEYRVGSNFFPVMAAGGSVKRDVVTLPPSYWMVDLLYFRRPAGLAEGGDVILQVHPEGWDEPVEVRFSLAPSRAS